MKYTDIIRWECQDCKSKCAIMFNDAYDCYVCRNCESDDIGPQLWGKDAEDMLTENWAYASGERYMNSDVFLERCWEDICDTHPEVKKQASNDEPIMEHLLDECMEYVEEKSAEYALDNMGCEDDRYSEE